MALKAEEGEGDIGKREMGWQSVVSRPQLNISVGPLLGCGKIMSMKITLHQHNSEKAALFALGIARRRRRGQV